jgi:DNA-binding SARP family transcriptional activator/TolB-like protein/Flp pilus assembly protein TadD
MLYLRTLGGLSVEVDRTPATGAAQQRKTLALLAVLARGGRRGVSRDRLIAYLWSERDREHGRGLLKQACYALRRDLHAPDLFLGGPELRLNPALISSDVELFEGAVESGDATRATALYAGPFLDGFYLDGAGEFERWVEAERDRLLRCACDALERLSTQTAAAGDHRKSAEHWHRLSALDPLNPRTALGLMKALTAAGDWPGALQAARVHERLLREELDVAPDAAVGELIEQLRAEPERRAPTIDTRPSDEQPGSSLETAGNVKEEARAASANQNDQIAAADHRVRGSQRAAVAVVAVIVGAALFGVWSAVGGRLGPRTAHTRLNQTTLVVLPFHNVGSSDDNYLADGITNEIMARVGSIEGLRVIAATSVYQRGGPTVKTVREIGKELNAAFVLQGTLHWQRAGQTQGRVRVTPLLVSTADGAQVWGHIYDEPLGEVFRIQSEIAQQVVRALNVTLVRAPQRRVLEAVPTTNLDAYDYYLRGNDYMTRGIDERYARAAERVYQEAVRLDPDFALAHARLSRVHSRMYWLHYDRSAERLALAKRSVDRAFELEPNLPHAHHSLGTYYWLGHLDYSRALREFALAEAQQPNESQLFITRAVLRTREGNFPAAFTDFERAGQLDPGSAWIASNHAESCDFARRFECADSLYDRAIERSPDWPYPYYLKAGLYLRWQGDVKKARTVLEEGRATGVADDPFLLLNRVLVDVFDRKYRAAMEHLSAGAPDVIASQFRLLPRAELYAQVYALMNRDELARAYYDSARILVAERISRQPGDARLHSALGIAYAGLGRKEDAIREGKKGLELMPIEKEAYRGYYRAWDLARIYAMTGQHDASVTQLEHLLSIPGHLTAAWLRIDPTWDALRANRRFKRLLYDRN